MQIKFYIVNVPNQVLNHLKSHAALSLTLIRQDKGNDVEDVTLYWTIWVQSALCAQSCFSALFIFWNLESLNWNN